MSGHPSETEAARRERGQTRLNVRLDEPEGELLAALAARFGGVKEAVVAALRGLAAAEGVGAGKKKEKGR